MPPGTVLNIDRELLELKYIYERLNLNMLSDFFDTDRNTIARYIKKYNIPKRNHSLYTFDEFFFESPNVLNSYWAGFIAADGCIANKKGENGSNYLSIGISEKDQDQLERFQRDIKFSGPITHTSKNICKIRIFSQKICNDLKTNFNITQRKTFTLEPPTQLNDDNFLAYFCGMIDGDGSVYYIRKAPVINLISTEAVLDWIVSRLRSLLDLKGALGTSISIHPKTKNIYYSMNIYKLNDIVKIYNAIKSLNIDVMDRKWDRIKHVLTGDTE